MGIVAWKVVDFTTSSFSSTQSRVNSTIGREGPFFFANCRRKERGAVVMGISDLSYGKSSRIGVHYDPSPSTWKSARVEFWSQSWPVCPLTDMRGVYRV